MCQGKGISFVDTRERTGAHTCFRQLQAQIAAWRAQHTHSILMRQSKAPLAWYSDVMPVPPPSRLMRWQRPSRPLYLQTAAGKAGMAM